LTSNLLTASEAIRDKLSSEQLVADCLERIKARDGDIRAWAYIDPEHALAQARSLDRMPRKGPLHGIPVGIKDVLDTGDMPTQHGSAVYRNHRPAKDCACVAALRRAGAVILGKTATTEFASPIPIGVRNPRDFTRTPGVSSSGSAAAVADFMVPLALGTQTGGSVIRPATYCGIYGYKGSIEAMDRGGIRHVRPSLDTVGLLARSLEDISLVCGKIAALQHRPRIGFCRTHEWPLAKPETQAAVLGAAQKLGATEIELPALFATALESFRVIVLRESARAYEREFRDHGDTMNDWLQDVAAKAAAVTDESYEKALLHAAECRAHLARVFREVDALITPATAGEASQKLTGLEDQTFCPLWTMMHGPCVTIPAFKGPNDMPMGLQVVGPAGGDERLLAVSAWIDSALKA
jgi:Asp-tRNA(Asn)/Glu-tRNA(Gln) amidotransferase A subunit family amidase